MLEKLIPKDQEEKESSSWNILDLVKLALCWALTLTTSTLLTTIGPLAAKHTGASDILAPFTIGTFLIGAAVSSVPSGPLFRKYGRYGGFAVGCACQMIGSASGALGMIIDSQVFLYIGCFFVGLGQGLGQFYRFAAVDISPPEYKSKAVTYVLSGGIIAAFLGPTSANYSINIISSSKYCGSFLVMGGIGLLNWYTLYLVNFPSADDEEVIELNTSPLNQHRTTLQIISHPVFILSCTVATIAHTVMVMIMSNCALSMDDDYSFRTTSLVLELHFLAMFLPGYLTGKLISDYGTFMVSIYGAILFAVSAVFFALGEGLWNYYGGMILLGIAWNFSFSAGTVMLTTCYAPHEAADVQAINDFILFTVAGGGSLISGVVYSHFNWAILIYLSSILMGFNLLLFGVTWKMKTIFTITGEIIKEGDYQPVAEDDNEQTLTDHDSRLGEEIYSNGGKKMSMASIVSLDEEREKVRSISVA